MTGFREVYIQFIKYTGIITVTLLFCIEFLLWKPECTLIQTYLHLVLLDLVPLPAIKRLWNWSSLRTIYKAPSYNTAQQNITYYDVERPVCCDLFYILFVWFFVASRLNHSLSRGQKLSKISWNKSKFLSTRKGEKVSDFAPFVVRRWGNSSYHRECIPVIQKTEL